MPDPVRNQEETLSFPEKCKAFNSFAHFPAELKHLDWSK